MLTRRTIVKIISKSKSIKNKSVAQIQIGKKWLQFMNSVNEWYILLDSNLKIVDINEPALRFFPMNTKKQDVIGRKFSDFSDEVKSRYAKFKKVLKTGRPYSEENIVTSLYQSGEKFVLNIKAFKIDDCLGIVATNVTRQKHAEERLIESEARYKLIFDNACPITFFDTNLNIVLANQASSEEIGIPLQKLIGMNKREMHGRLPKEQVDFIINREMQIIHNGRGDMFVDEVEFEAEKQWYMTNSQPVIDKQGKIVGVVVFAYNITRQKNMEKDLEKRNAELEESNMVLNVLLKQLDEERMEHEEKVLSNIKSLVLPYINKIKESELSDVQRSYVDIVEKNIDGVVSSFIHDVSSGYYQLSPTEIQVANLIMQGRNTKEMAAIMSLSGKTIESHRKSIRKKTGILNKKVNLRTHLLSIQNN